MSAPPPRIGKHAPGMAKPKPGKPAGKPKPGGKGGKGGRKAMAGLINRAV